VADAPTLREKWPSILATVIIAPSSAWLLSFAGVYGTLSGVLIGSALSGTGGALIERWIRLSHAAAARKLAEHKAAAAHGRHPPLHADEDPWERYYRPAAAIKRFDIPWHKAMLWGLAALVLSAGSVGVAQLISHRTASDLVTGAPVRHPAPRQTTVSPVPSYSPLPTATWTPSPAPDYSPTPSPTPDYSPTPSPAPSPAPTPTAAPAPTVSPTPSPIITK
jgi:hypothetical protein